MRRFADTMAWADDRGFAIHAALDERKAFIRKTYTHLTVQLAAVGVMTWVVMNTPLRAVAAALWSSYIVYIIAFFAASLISRKLLEGHKSMAMQYTGAGIWILFLSLLVAPLALYAEQAGKMDVLGEAFLLTVIVFSGLTAYVFVSKKDFSFLGGALSVVSWTVIGFVLISTLFGGTTGTWLTWVVVVLFAGWILYDTSRVLHHRRVDEYVAASVDLMVDFVYMFIHIAMLLLSSRD